MQLATTRGVKAISLGSYQPNPDMTTVLLKSERAVTAQASIDYLDVQTNFMAGKRQHPYLEWLYADKGHPGHDLTLLQAVLLFKHLFGHFPEAKALTVNAPMYKPKSSFATPNPTSLPALTQDIVLTHHYHQTQLAAIMATLQSQVK